MRVFALLVTLLMSGSVFAKSVQQDLVKQDIVWTTPSVDAAGSMPIGNGEVVLNAWVDARTSEICLLIARTDALSEIARILKIGRVRVKLTPNPFVGGSFEQRLDLYNGQIHFRGKDASLTLFVDSDNHVVHLTGTSKLPVIAQVTTDNWRDTDRPLPEIDFNSAWSAKGAPVALVESADVPIDRRRNNQIGWYHTNRSSIVPVLLAEQTLTGLNGTFDPLLGRTFGAVISGAEMTAEGKTKLVSQSPSKAINVNIAVHTNRELSAWESETVTLLARSPSEAASARTKKWWNQYWDRSYVFVEEKLPSKAIPDNDFPIRRGQDSNGQNMLPGSIREWKYSNSVDPKQVEQDFGHWLDSMDSDVPFHPKDLTLRAYIHLTELKPGRIFDKLTAGRNDGFLLDTHPGDSLRFIVGDKEITAKGVLTVGKTYAVEASFNSATGEAKIFLDGKQVASSPAELGSPITRGYTLQRYVQACQGRGNLPIKFNGGYYTVEPTAMGRQTNSDFRNWGDAFWFQNTRHVYHPMLANGDFDMMEPFWRLYEDALPLAKSRAASYHGVKGAYFPETMTAFGTYAGSDYGWDRKGLKPNEVQCPWWDDAWNQGLELVNLMLDRFDYTQDRAFLTKRVLPMADEVLAYFDSRFKRDGKGKLLIDPTQVVETYWDGVVNDMPVVSGLHRILGRLNSLPAGAVKPSQASTYSRLLGELPELPLEVRDGKRQLSPAEKYIKKESNVENGELYAVWPFGTASLAQSKLVVEAKNAYATRKNRLDTGWGYDGNVAAMLGMTEEAARILNVKVRNSHPAYRWPATWGPNFDWLPDQNHGGNLMTQTHLMLMQCEPMELGGAIRLLPAWPKDWDVKFRLFAPGKTVIECDFRNGKVEKLSVTPETRRKDIIMP
ncbi:MAG: DUF5703 domain-containing protein [Armatimonadota bacterium]